MNRIFAWALDITPKTTHIGVQKIDEAAIKMYEIFSASFSLQNRSRKVRIFEQIFLLADTNVEVVFGMLFLKICY